MELAIELTRKCNMQCTHCLRGCAENNNIDNKYITSMLEQVQALEMSISVVLTGGEPSLNISSINHFISECKRLNVDLMYFYIATNGYNLGIEFAEVCLKLYALSSEKDMCSVKLSSDYQHSEQKEIYNRDLELMEGLAFFSRRDENYDYNDPKANFISEGYAKENYTHGNPLEVYEFDYSDFESTLDDHIIYLNAKGMLINGCDWSYKSQDTRKDIQICRVEDFTKWYTKHSIEG